MKINKEMLRIFEQQQKRDPHRSYFLLTPPQKKIKNNIITKQEHKTCISYTFKDFFRNHASLISNENLDISLSGHMLVPACFYQNNTK